MKLEPKDGRFMYYSGIQPQNGKENNGNKRERALSN